MLTIDEHIRADSSTVRTHLRLAPGGEHIHIEVDGGASGTMSVGAIVHVIRRYARPLDDALVDGHPAPPRLPPPAGTAIALLHGRAAVDAAGRDWLVLLVPGEEPQAALSNGVAAALRYLVLRLQDER
jgi:hypothetical protein